MRISYGSAHFTISRLLSYRSVVNPTLLAALLGSSRTDWTLIDRDGSGQRFALAEMSHLHLHAQFHDPINWDLEEVRH
jgi:hypothetical protein